MGHCGGLLTDTGRHSRATLLVALGAAVAGESSDAVLAGTLSSVVVARPSVGAHWVTVTGCEWERERVSDIHMDTRNKRLLLFHSPLKILHSLFDSKLLISFVAFVIPLLSHDAMVYSLLEQSEWSRGRECVCQSLFLEWVSLSLPGRDLAVGWVSVGKQSPLSGRLLGFWERVIEICSTLWVASWSGAQVRRLGHLH